MIPINPYRNRREEPKTTPTTADIKSNVTWCALVVENTPLFKGLLVVMAVADG